MSHCTRSEVDVRAPPNPLSKPFFPFVSQVMLLPQVRAAFPCAARDTSEAAARQVSAGSKRGACSRALTLLFRTCCICCGLHGVHCTRCIACVLRMLR
jgi:hypothetical protein